MYLGSVRFFKHIIIGTLLLLLLLISVFIFYIFQSVLFWAEAGSTPDAAYLSSIAELPSLENLSADLVIGREKPKKAVPSYELSAITPVKSGLTTLPDINKPYRLLYPTLYCNEARGAVVQKNTVYLTFDDGPSQLTLEVLKILKENDVKATFFTVGKADEGSKKIMRQIVDEGHTIAVHSNTHNYTQIYSSVEAYLEDFYNMHTLITEATGIKADIFRFPGGSVNSYNSTIYKDIIEEMTRRGFTYYDWNVASADTASGATAQSIYGNVMNGVSKVSTSTVLFHDSSGKQQTILALDGIIKNLKKQGYAFDRLTNKTKPVVFKNK